MLNRIGISFLIILLVGCSAKPDFPTYQEVALANDHLKKSEPKYVEYTVKGLKSVKCEDDICAMTEKDFRQNQHDKKNLLELHKLDHQRYSKLTEIYNLQIDRVTINQMTAVELDKALYYKKQELNRAETGNTIQKWLERGSFILLCITVACW